MRTFDKSHPELFHPPFSDQLPTVTLKDIGAKKSCEAQKLGYVCLKESTSSGSSARPGLWLHPDLVPLLPTAIEEIEKNRVDLAEKKAAAAEEKLQAVRQKNLSRSIKELAKLSSLPAKSVSPLIDEEWSAIFSRNEGSSYALLHKARAPAWIGLQPNQTTLTYKHPEGIHVLAVNAGACIALLNHDAAAYEQAMDRQLDKQRKIASKLEKTWSASRPEWYSAEKLTAWALHSCALENVEHPILLAPKTRKLLESEVQVHFGGQPVMVSINKEYVLSKLWGTQELVGDSVASHVNSLALDALCEQADAGAQLFVEQNLETVDLKKFQYSEDEARGVLKQAFFSCISTRFELDKALLAGRAKVSKILAKRIMEITADLCRNDMPHYLKDFYPLARTMNREITFIYGPTNSGKTYKALEILKGADRGVYLGPLRLLALEVFDKLNEEGVPTSLVTGELVTRVEGETHIAATIEMLDMSTPVDVAVIDEVQNLSDPDRGAAWFQAILGAPARHVVLLGSESALEAVRFLAEKTGEPLNEIQVKRLSPLVALDHPVKLNQVSNGSALIAFSRKGVLSLASQMRSLGKKVSVIYGSLSPEVRAEQARKFREGETQIVVSTDAIGLGLNLPVKTVVFTTLTKWDGKCEGPINHALALQISGRAGRYGLHEKGYVTAMEKHDVRILKKMLSTPVESIGAPFSITINMEVASSISRRMGTNSLSQIIAFFRESMQIEDWAIPSTNEDQLFLAGYLDRFDLNLAEKLLLSNAPALEKGSPNTYLNQIIACIVDKKVEKMTILDQFWDSNLEILERLVKDATLYQWMHYRFPALFPRIDESKAVLKKFNKEITRLLGESKAKTCTQCKKKLEWNFPHAKCQDCFHAYRNHDSYDSVWN